MLHTLSMHNPLARQQQWDHSMNFSLSKYSGAAMMATPILMFAAHAATASVLSGVTNKPNNSTFFPGDTITVTFHASGLTAGKATTVNIKVKEAFGYELASASILATADASGSAYAVYHAPSTRYGYYRVEAALPDGTAVASL